MNPKTSRSFAGPATKPKRIYRICRALPKQSAKRQSISARDPIPDDPFREAGLRHGSGKWTAVW
jgi:hypothetical protein